MKLNKYIALSLSAFFLNFAWESIHGVYLYEGCLSSDVRVFMKCIFYASFKDMAIILGIFSACGLICRDIFWEQTGRKKTAFIIVSSILVAGAIEIKALYIFDQWSYSDLMPTVFGLGLSPLLQLAVTGLISLWLIYNLKNVREA